MPAIPIRLPELGAAGEPVRVSCWLVDLGDEIDAGDRVVEMLVRGMTFDVQAPCSGTLVRIEKSMGATAAAGDVLGWIRSVAPEDGDA